jgi:hypothetical protein
MQMKAVAITRTLVAGVVGAAAVLGVLVGIGRRGGTPWRPVNAMAHALLGARADDVWNFSWGVTPAGAVVLLATCIVAALAIAAFARRGSWARLATSAAAVAIAGYLLHLHVVARTAGGLAEVLDVGELRAVYAVAAIALASGMRFAFYPPDATLDP